LKGNYSFNHQYFSYISRSKYAEQIEKWEKFFPIKNFLIIKSEDFFSNPSPIIEKVYDFLDFQKIHLNNFKKFNVENYKPMNPKTRNYLLEYFKPSNEQLFKLTKRNFQWDD